MERSKSKFAWTENFPAVYGHTSISFLKHCPGYQNAKNGDIDAALNIVGICSKKDLIIKIKDKYPDAVLLPIIAKNKLPEALAMETGLKVRKTIYQSKIIDRKSLSGMERLLHMPTFGGYIKKGENYIIVDDIVTQGGTISALRKYVISNGGFVTAIIALAYSVNSQKIAPDLQDISDLTVKFNCKLLTYILKEYHIAEEPGELTKSQIKCLLKSKNLTEITNKLEKAYTKLSRKGYNPNPLSIS